MATAWATMETMTSEPRSKGATVPLDRAELNRLTTQTTSEPATIVRPNANVVPARRSISAHLPLVPPKEIDEDEVVVTVEMSDDDDEEAARAPRSRSETLANPLTMSQLVESERGQPKPAAPTPASESANRNIKRRG
jgi:hypothetical protein